MRPSDSFEIGSVLAFSAVSFLTLDLLCFALERLFAPDPGRVLRQDIGVDLGDWVLTPIVAVFIRRFLGVLRLPRGRLDVDW